MSPLVLDDERRAILLGIAADAVGRALTNRGVDVPPDLGGDDPLLRRDAAAFVTLERDTRLLGCIGTLDATQPLAVATARYALAAAFADPRLPPVSADDFTAMTIKISVLSEPEPVAAGSYRELAATVRPGVDGLVLDAGGRGATLLPSVWQHLPETERFLDALWRKAGIRPGTWTPRTRLRRYTTDEFAAAGPRELPLGPVARGTRSW